MLIFLIALGESCIMEETSDLEILEVLTIDSLCHSEVGSTVEDSLSMPRIVIRIVLAVFEKGTCIYFC
jgi:hypothetical protein